VPDLSTVTAMRFDNSNWSLKQLIDKRDIIDPRPAFQRGPVWKDQQRQLLVDSIFTGYDIPKIYLRYLGPNGVHQYEVADGQQRLTAIFLFYDDQLPVGTIAGNKTEFTGCVYSALPDKFKKQFLAFELTTSIVHDATNEQVRELFARLQKGSKLTPPELRNSMPSTLGDIIRAMAVTHKFFKLGPFPFERHYTDDLLAHAFAIELYGGSRDSKAPDLAAMYREYQTEIPAQVVPRVNKVLKFMNEMQKAEAECIHTKWGFVDLYWIVSKHIGRCPAPDVLAKRYVNWEAKRLRYNATPEGLLDPRNGERDKAMYDYIQSFQRQGATRKNLNLRHAVLTAALIS
jgi:hypothetical protein